MQLLFDNAKFRYTPYPIGIAKPIWDDVSYKALVDEFPPDELLLQYPFRNETEGYKKYALNERLSKPYYTYLEAHPIWGAFYLSIKGKEFPYFICKMLKGHGIEVTPSHSWTTRFEFAGMPADGGYIAPHTDISSKAVTLVFSMLRPGDWNPAFGGGTDVLKPKDPHAKLESYRAPLEVFEKVGTYEYTPNQCVIFVKNDISWHSVGPMTGKGSPLLRRTLTLNIERGK